MTVIIFTQLQETENMSPVKKAMQFVGSKFRSVGKQYFYIITINHVSSKLIMDSCP